MIRNGPVDAVNCWVSIPPRSGLLEQSVAHEAAGRADSEINIVRRGPVNGAFWNGHADETARSTMALARPLSDRINSFDDVRRRLIGARSTFGLARRLSGKIDRFGNARRRNPMLGLVRGRMPATSFAAERSILVDRQTLRRTRPLNNGVDCNVKVDGLCKFLFKGNADLLPPGLSRSVLQVGGYTSCLIHAVAPCLAQSPSAIGRGRGQKLGADAGDGSGQL